MWDLPGPGLEPVSPALAGGFLTTAPPGKSSIFLVPDFFLSYSSFWWRPASYISQTPVPAATLLGSSMKGIDGRSQGGKRAEVMFSQHLTSPLAVVVKAVSIVPTAAQPWQCLMNYEKWPPKQGTFKEASWMVWHKDKSRKHLGWCNGQPSTTCTGSEQRKTWSHCMLGTEQQGLPGKGALLQPGKTQVDWSYLQVPWTSSFHLNTWVHWTHTQESSLELTSKCLWGLRIPCPFCLPSWEKRSWDLRPSFYWISGENE